MLAQTGCLHKKKELSRAVDYLEGRITGTEFIESLNESVRMKNRVGKIRRINVPFIYAVGLRQRYLRSAARRAVLTDEQKRQIAIERAANKLSYEQLAVKYNVSITTIARVLGAHR
jgi:hypothetical protein